MSVAIQSPHRHASRSWKPGERTLDGDIHVAKRLLAARKIAGKSQEQAAEVLDITFQQLQKYERGANRITCGKLAILAKFYGVNIGYFFDGIAEAGKASPDLGACLIAEPYGAALAKCFVHIKSKERRKMLVDLAIEFAGP